MSGLIGAICQRPQERDSRVTAIRLGDAELSRDLGRREAQPEQGEDHRKLVSRLVKG